MGTELNGAKILLARLHGKVYAYQDSCPHQGTKLSAGSLCKNVLTCITHGWEFNLETGRGVNPESARLTSVPVKIKDHFIYLDIKSIPGAESIGERSAHV